MAYENTAKSLVKQTRMKPGANAYEATKIQEMLAEGATPLEISQKMFIRLECVESFVPTERAAPPKAESAELPEGAQGFSGVFRRGRSK